MQGKCWGCGAKPRDCNRCPESDAPHCGRCHSKHGAYAPIGRYAEPLELQKAHERGLHGDKAWAKCPSCTKPLEAEPALPRAPEPW